jgi:hypothetical protein
MSKISKFVKLDKNILLEYVYDSENNLSEAYEVLVNSKEKRFSYLATSTSGTNNTRGNSLFRLDNISNRYGKIDPSYYTFLQLRNYSAPAPIKHDTIRIHLPVNWTFGEYLGFYIRVYGFDTVLQQSFDLSNFYFDMSDVSQSYLLNYSSPPLLFQEKLWGKNITIDIPALGAIALQRQNNRPKENSINANLTNNAGFSLTSPVFIDFNFINNIQTVNGISTYILAPKISTTVPQTPELEDLGLMIKHSNNGDFFEIYATYNGTIGGFKQFIDDSVYAGHRYYVEYQITTFEQNVRGKTLTTIVTDNFNETIEYRPIIKFSTTTAIIDVEMRLIDAVDETYVVRRGSYGMLQDEVARYSLKLIKINLQKASKPKIYNIKNSIDPSLVGLANSMGMIKVRKNRLSLPPRQIAPASANSILTNDVNISNNNINPLNNGLVSNAPSNISSMSSASTQPANPQVSIQTVNVPYPVLYDRFNIITKSENANFGNNKYFGNSKMTITLYPFDNVLKFSIAKGTNESPEFYDLTGFTELKFVIKNDVLEASFPLYTQSNEVNLKNGQVVFRIPENRMGDIKKIFNSNSNIFYIVGSTGANSSLIYSGLFKLHDSPKNLAELNAQSIKDSIKESSKEDLAKEIKLDPSLLSNLTSAAVSQALAQAAQTNLPQNNSNISQEVAPTPKPTNKQDLIKQGINPKPKDLLKSQELKAKEVLDKSKNKFKK